MSRFHRFLTPVLLAGALVFISAGCGDDDGQQQQCGDGVCEGTETIAHCPQDCALCGNGVLDADEACDGDEFGGETCETLGHGGGSLFCNADCSINEVAACCEHGCETVGQTQCVGSLVQACEVTASGCRDWVDQVDCGASSEVCLVRSGVAACEEGCADECPAQDDSQCSGSILQVCTLDDIDSCLYWVDDTDCAVTGYFCEDFTGTAECVDDCLDECATIGAQQCSGDVIDDCQLGVDGCNDLVQIEDCAAVGELCNDSTGQPFCCADACLNPGETRCSTALDSIEVCNLGTEGCNEWQHQSDCTGDTVCQPVAGTAQCIAASGESCADPLPLTAGVNSVSWTATTLDYLLTASNYSCTTYAPDGGDVVLTYTATVNGYLDLLVPNKPTNTRWVLVVSSGACGTLAPEEACITEYGATEMGGVLPVTAGTTYYFYMVDTTSGSNPLSNPFDIVLTEIDCVNPNLTVTSSVPAAGAVDVWATTPITINFSSRMLTNMGTVTLTGTGGTNLVYDLTTNPAEVDFSNNNLTMTVTPGTIFQTGETVTVTLAGMQDELCSAALSASPWVFDVAASLPPGEDCTNAMTLLTGTQQYLWYGTTADYFTNTPCGSTTYAVDGPDVVGEFTASVNGYIDIVMQKPASNRMFMAAYESACGDLSQQVSCTSDYSPTTLSMHIPVVSGQSYYVYFADTTSGSQPLPNPLDVTITETDCAPIPAGVASGESPADGATDVIVNAPLSVSFDKAVRMGFGSVTVTGTLGSSYTFDLSTAPAEVEFSNGDQTMTITLPAYLALSETVTVSWTGLQDAECGKAIAPIPWSFTTVATLPPGESCADPIALTTGDATYTWFADQQDFFSTTPCGTTTSVLGGDVVGEFTASVNGFLSITMNKPASNRMFMAMYNGPCGSLAFQLDCHNDYSPPQLNVIAPITAGSDYYVYFGDTSSGTQPLPNPLELVITEIDCATFSAQGIGFLPANGGLTQSLYPTFSVDFDVAPTTTDGTVLITGDQGTSLSYPMSAAQVSFSNDDRTMTIDPGTSFPPGENLTLTWTGMTDSLCGNAVSAPIWDVTIITPPCSPGTGGMVGSAQTLVPSGLTSGTEYYVAADDDPNGWVYMGGASILNRTPKAGGATESVYALAGLSTAQTGYAMLINGLDIFTIDSITTGTNGKLWRISSDGGATWLVEDFATFPVAPAEDFRAATVWNGRIYLVTHEGTSTTPTEIWSVSANPATVPDTAVLEGTFSGEVSCSAIAADDFHFYIGCSTGDRVIRVAHADAPNYQVALITDVPDMSVSSNSLYTTDFNADGVADVLYVHGYSPEVWYVCDPSGVAYLDLLTTVGSVNYGMGFDPVANALWLYDDGSRDFVSLH